MARTKDSSTVDPMPAAAEVRAELAKGLKIFRAFEYADKALALLENIEQVTAERQAAADSAAQQVHAAQAELTSAAAALADAKDEARRLAADAKRRADERLARAETEAKAMLAEAQGRVDALRAEADAMTAALLEQQQSLALVKGEYEQTMSHIAEVKAKARASLEG